MWAMMLKWLLGPVGWLYVKRLEADVKAESERADLWMRHCNASEAREVVAQQRIAALEKELTDAATACCHPGVK
jgi:hypothetical protein